MTHIGASRLSITGLDKVGAKPLSEPGLDGILLIRPLGTNFSEILSEIRTFSFKKMHLKMSSAKGRLFRLGLIKLTLPMCIYHGAYIWVA